MNITSFYLFSGKLKDRSGPIRQWWSKQRPQYAGKSQLNKFPQRPNFGIRKPKPFNLYMIICNNYNVASFKNVMFVNFTKLQIRVIILNLKSKLFSFKIENIYSVYINGIFKIKP